MHKKYETQYLDGGDFRLYRFCSVEYRFPKLIGCSEAILLTTKVENSAVSGPQAFRLGKLETQPAIA